MSKHFVGSQKACEILGVHYMSLKKWEEDKTIEYLKTPGGKRLYNVEKYIADNLVPVHTDIKEKAVEEVKEDVNNEPQPRRKICYCRVSSSGQKDDLTRQIDFMKNKYPDYELIKDIGSGLNFKRPGLNKLIQYAINGEVEEVIIAYRDRLCRFGFDLIEHIILSYSKGKIEVLNEEHLSPEDELTHDLVSIINVFSARINGLRKYKKKFKNIQISKPDKT